MSGYTNGVNRVNISQAAANIGCDGLPAGTSAEVSSSKLLRGIKGIIFDFDGTLFDNTHIAFRLVSAYPLDLFKIWKERLIRKRFAGCDYSSSENYFRAFFAALGKACSRSPQRMQNWYFNRYMPRMVRVLRNHYQLRPGVQELFRHHEISGGLRLAVYSDYPFLKERLEALGFYPGPRLPLYGPESFGAQKPAVGSFLRIAGELGVSPEEILVVGDREETDGIGAFKSGMRFFCLETSHDRYLRFDPNRRRVKEQLTGPSLVMYAGNWDDLVKLLMENR
ncbi:MAG: HAD family hydrolase [Treponema sp.]|jgi:HAD superfamily hydrolase (TIGR01549 family)|nr:HAD family hydrolase [Treponema sp.]